MNETCEYLTRHAGNSKLVECGQPATLRGVKPPRKFYCEEHGKLVGHPRNRIDLMRIATPPKDNLAAS